MGYSGEKEMVWGKCAFREIKVKKAGEKKYIPHDGGASSTLMLDESARAIFDNH